VLKGAQEDGALTEKVILNTLKISPCQSCNVCQETGTCALQDDMATLFEKMNSSHVWVLGTPIYWWGPTGQFKVFIDRWFGARDMTFRGHGIILTIPMGGGSPKYARHTVGMLEDIINYLGMELLATILAPGAQERGTVRNHAQVLKEAFQAGQKAASWISV
jgi:hypothetical protein